MSERVLVTGATGFIGRALVRGLQDASRQVILLGSRDGDVREFGTFARYSGAGVASVIHLAGRSFVPDSWAEPASFLDINVRGTTNALEFCRREKAGLVFLSAYIYGLPERLPISETAPVRPNNPYAESKYLAELVCRFYSEQFAVPVTVLRPFNVYGPGQNTTFLIPSILRYLRAQQQIEVMDLEPRRDWVYVSDLVSAIMAARDRLAGYNAYNVGSGSSYSVAEVIAIAQRAAGTALPVRSAAQKRPNEIQDVVADITRAKRDLGWSPRYGLEAGMLRCWQALQDAK